MSRKSAPGRASCWCALLGGVDYWRYGVDELAALARTARRQAGARAGRRRDDPRLDAASTLTPTRSQQIWRYFERAARTIWRPACTSSPLELGAATAPPPPATRQRLRPSSSGCAAGRAAARRSALIVFYRSIYLAGDTAPIEALAERSRARASRCERLRHEPEGPEPRSRRSRDCSRANAVDVILNATAFSARLDEAAASRRGRRAGAAGRAGGHGARAMARFDARPRRRRPRHERRAAGDRRAHAHPRDFVQDGGGATPRLEFARRRPCAARRRVDFVADLAARLGAPATNAARRAATRLVLSGLSRARADAPATPSASIRRAASSRSARLCARRATTSRADADAPTLIARLVRRPPERGSDARRIRSAHSPHCPAISRARCTPPGASPAPIPAVMRRRVRFRVPARRQAHRRAAARSRATRPRARANITMSTLAAAPRLCRVLSLARAQGAHRRDDPSRHARHAGMAAGQGGGSVARLARPKAVLGAGAGDLSLHRQQSRRGGAGQAPHRRGHDRPSDAAADRRRDAWRAAELEGLFDEYRRRRRRSIRAAPARSPS